MRETRMTWGNQPGGLQIGGGTQPRMREFMCTSQFPPPLGCGYTTWTEMDRPECPHHLIRMVPVPDGDEPR